MIYLSLPLFYQNLDFYLTLNNYIDNNKLDTSIKISSAFGSFPFAIFNGGSNINFSSELLLLNNDIYYFLNNKMNCIPFRLDCSNILIEDFDLKNIYQNIILNYAHNAGNFLEISDFRMLNYLQKEYPNFEFIFSKNSNLINPLTPEIINTILEQDIFYLIEIPNNQKKNLDFLNKIKQKNKIEITIGNKCLCNDTLECELKEQGNIIKYSNETLFYNCNKLNSYDNQNELINEINFYRELGFTHFKVDTPPISKNKNFKNYLIYNLIKEEYQLKLLNEE